MAKKKKKALFTFRRYRKAEGGKTKRAKHPKLIVEETKDEYGFMGLTEAKKRGHHKNIALKRNPEKGNDKQAFLRDELRYDRKRNFSDVLRNYDLSDEDKAYIIEYLNKKGKKKK